MGQRQIAFLFDNLPALECRKRYFKRLRGEGANFRRVDAQTRIVLSMHDAAQPSLLKTALTNWHVSHGGKMVDFAGWHMPVQYRSIVEEHNATRRAMGLFDVSHMGRLSFTGPGSAAFLDSVLSRNVLSMVPGEVRYSLITNDQGGVMDDVLVYCLKQSPVERYRLVVNASNREKIWAWLSRFDSQYPQVELRDDTFDTAMFAVQGPLAIEAVRPLVASPDPAGIKYYTAVETKIGKADGLISRTGYTGEDGWEIIVPANAAVAVWSGLLEHGAAHGAVPAGLGCRDTLRIEAAMPLYGHELAETISPDQAGLSFAVNLEGHSFPGHDALVALKAEGLRRIPRRVGLLLSGRRVPREHCGVFMGGRQVGQVTSGTFSPTMQQPIAMAYIEPASAQQGTQVEIDIRGKRETATIVKLPFYRRGS